MSQEEKDNKLQFPGVTHYSRVDVHVQPGGINIQHVENLYQADVLKALGIELEVKKSAPVAPQACAEPDEVLEDLLPFFWGDEAEVRKFLRKVEGAKAVDVVAEVNRLLAERKVSDKSCHKPLWEVLNKHGIYPRNLSNWNTQIQV